MINHQMRRVCDLKGAPPLGNHVASERQQVAGRERRAVVAPRKGAELAREKLAVGDDADLDVCIWPHFDRLRQIERRQASTERC